MLDHYYWMEVHSSQKKSNMEPSFGQVWGHRITLQRVWVLVDCLLPNGVLVPLRCPGNSPLEVVKGELWKEAQNYPLFHVLKDAASYIFVSTTQDGEREEFYDETRRLCDLRLFQPILKVVESAGNKKEKMPNYEIGISLRLPVHELDKMMTKDAKVLELTKDAKVLELTKDAKVLELTKDAKVLELTKDAKVLGYRKKIMNVCKSAWLTLSAWLKQLK